MPVHTPLQTKIDELERESSKSGTPRVEAEAEMMRDVQKERSSAVGPASQKQGVNVGSVPAYRPATRKARKGAEL